MDEGFAQVLAVEPRIEAKRRAGGPEAVQVILEAEEAALPHVHHVVGDVRAGKAPVEDRHLRLGNRDELAVHEGRAIGKVDTWSDVQCRLRHE